MENREKAGEGICILSFDGGGPGSLSQLCMLDELMQRLAFDRRVKVDELHPADYFDLMGGVGFGGLVALLLGRLRMTTSQAMEELATIGTQIFSERDEMVTREVKMSRLRNAVESMLSRHGHPVDIQLLDSSGNRCKVVLFAATTAIMDHCHPFRTYPVRRKSRECTFVEAACATIAVPEYFSSVDIGPRLRKQSFAGIPHGFDNPMREVLKESQEVFGETNPVSLVLSLGSGKRARLSDLDYHVTRLSRIHCDSVSRDLHYQLRNVGEYIRLNVDNGLEKVELDDWSKLGSIEDHTEVYLQMNPIRKYVDKACQWLQQRNGSVTLGQLSGTDAGCETMFHSEGLEDYLKMEFKEIKDVMGIERITLVDAIGRPIRIPIEFCDTYTMLLGIINFYFKHKKAPGSDFVERGDYRLVHGDRKNIMGQMEWTRIDKAGLKVEMSVILRTRNQSSARCPSCSTSFEGRDIDGWAQCLSCSTQFQTETQVQVEPQVQSDDTIQSEEEPLTELVTPEVRESEGSQPPTRKRPSGGEAVQLQFRLISVINTTDVPFSHPLEETQQPEDKGQAPGGSSVLSHPYRSSSHASTNDSIQGELALAPLQQEIDLEANTRLSHGDMPSPNGGPSFYNSYSPNMPLFGGSQGDLVRMPLQQEIDDARLVRSEPDTQRPPKPQGKLLVHDKVVHTPETQMRILRLSKREQAIVLTNGGNTVESQLRVLNTIERYPPDHNNQRVWTEASLLLPSGRETIEYHCKAAGCEYREVKFQKARQHFVSSHVAEACWGCPIEGCAHVGKYKRLDDLRHHHMVPSHGVEYTRNRKRPTNASTAGEAAFHTTSLTSPRPDGQVHP